ncbi:MAG TPA: hypothetical protein DCE43_07585, partial [Planctomycetaceae bacterium]|nr:hypothetical protein [Planctomycetaceae bacterium]
PPRGVRTDNSQDLCSILNILGLPANEQLVTNQRQTHDAIWKILIDLPLKRGINRLKPTPPF